MKIARLTWGGRTRIALVDPSSQTAHESPAPLAALLGADQDTFARVCDAARRAPGVRLADARVRAPLAPAKFFGVGLNYAAHAKEMGRPTPEQPACFLKAAGCVIGPGAAIERPRGVTTLDYEGELGVVIGRACRDVSAEDAMGAVGGYVVVNDVTAREWLAPDRLVVAKGCDTFGPMGPWITRAEEVDLDAGLRLRTWVNRELRQDSTTADMIFGVPQLIAFFSRGATLRPGDVITTGSPSGSGASFAPPRFLEPGSVVAVEIEGLGRLENPVRQMRRRA